MNRYQPTNYENLTEDRQELFQSIAFPITAPRPDPRGTL